MSAKMDSYANDIRTANGSQQYQISDWYCTHVFLKTPSKCSSMLQTESKPIAPDFAPHYIIR